MSFRAKEFLERNEMVRFQLDNAIRIPANGQHQGKTGYKLDMIGIMHILKYSFNYKN